MVCKCVKMKRSRSSKRKNADIITTKLVFPYAPILVSSQSDGNNRAFKKAKCIIAAVLIIISLCLSYNYKLLVSLVAFIVTIMYYAYKTVKEIWIRLCRCLNKKSILQTKKHPIITTDCDCSIEKATNQTQNAKRSDLRKKRKKQLAVASPPKRLESSIFIRLKNICIFWIPSCNDIACFIVTVFMRFMLPTLNIMHFFCDPALHIVCQFASFALFLFVNLRNLWTAIFLNILPRFLLTFLKVCYFCCECIVVTFVPVFWGFIVGNVLWKPSANIFQKQSIRQRHSFNTGGAMASPSSTSSSSLSPTLESVSLLERDGRGGRYGSSILRGPRSTTGPKRGIPQRRNAVKINFLDCHYDWITELMPMYLTSTEKADYLTAVIQSLVEWLEDIKGTVVTPGVPLNIRIMLACFHAHLGHFNEALDWLSEAVDNMRTVSDESVQHVRAHSYLLQTNFYKINRRMKLMEGISMKLVDAGTAQDLKELEGLFSENEGSFQAAIRYSKGLVEKIMYHQDKHIESYRDAVELEPTCAHWHRALYQAIRKRRREQRGVYGFRPSYEEKVAITRAYELDPDFCLNQSMYAGMLEEKMKGNKEIVLPETNEEIANEVISLMLALDNNPEDKWTHVRLAEIYAYGNFPHLDSKDGERMFEELEERWPDESMVLHKFGKYFVLSENQPEKALEYYARALECDSGNFPCLMDYLKTSIRSGKGYQHMLEMVEKCLGQGGLFHNTGPFIRMMLAKAILLWLLDNNIDGGDNGTQQKACQVLVEAAVKDPASCVFIAKTIASGYWDILGKYSFDIDKLLSILKVFLNLANSQRNVDQIKAIERLTSELQTQMENNCPTFRGGTRSRNYSTSSSRSSVSNCSFVTAKSSQSQSIADSVDNWRMTGPQIPPDDGGKGIFAKYQDPMELSFRGGFSSGLTAASGTLGLQNPSSGRQRGDNKKTSSYQTPSPADLDNHWRF